MPEPSVTPPVPILLALRQAPCPVDVAGLLFLPNTRSLSHLFSLVRLLSPPGLPTSLTSSLLFSF